MGMGMESPQSATEANSGLTHAQLETLRARLEQYRLQLLGQVGEMPSPFTREHTEEPHAMENAEIDVELEQHAKLEIELIEAALRRIDLGSYGTCCDCANPIGFARLEAYPMTRRCIACKRDYEQRQ